MPLVWDETLLQHALSFAETGVATRALTDDSNFAASALRVLLRLHEDPREPISGASALGRCGTQRMTECRHDAL